MEFEDKTAILDAKALEAMRSERRSAVFIVIAGTETGRMHKVDSDEMVIGRAVEAGIRIVDDGVSRRHAKILRNEDSSLAIVDLGSTNGTFCNGERISHRVLQDGDKIQIGTTTILKFSFTDEVEEDFQRRQYEWATRDALTNCFNKKYFIERLPAELAYAKRHGKALSLAMCDIDHFKRLNDTFGHQAGDYVLRQAAKVMLETVRQEDMVARWGGEEFAVIMRDTRADPAFIAAERIRRKVEATDFVYEKQHISVTLSIGIATWLETSSESAESLMRRADEYLYRAKHHGRNRTESAVLEGGET